jgi:hypothetical protein
VRKVNLVLVMRELNGERKRVQLDCLDRRTLLAGIVTDVSSASMPANAFLLRVFLRVNQWLHSLVVKRVGLDQVYEVELVGLILARVSHPEVIPLRLDYCCAMILFKLKVIFKFRDLHSLSKISAFKSAFKYKGIVARAF